MPLAIITGSGGLIGSESVAHFVEAGFDVIGIENDMRSYFFGPSASTASRSAEAGRAIRRQLPLARARHPRRRRDRPDLRGACTRPRARHPHSGPAVARLGGDRAAHGLHRQRQRNAQPARGDAAPQARGHVHLHARRTRSTATARTSFRSSSWRPASSSRRSTSSTVASRRRCRSTAASTRSSASRKLPRICSSRSTDGTSGCRRSASGAAASPARITQARSSTGSSPTSCAAP